MVAKIENDWINCKQTKAKRRVENTVEKEKLKKKMHLGIECTMDTKWQREEKLKALKAVPASSIT